MLSKRNNEFNINQSNWRKTDRTTLPGLMSALSQDLQRSLELADILQQFNDAVCQAIDHCGFDYCHYDRDVGLCCGEQGLHCYTYNLSLENESLGRIIFSRDTPLSTTEVSSLEEMLMILLYPLKNALTYHKVLAATLMDPLTEIGNRKAFNESLIRELDYFNRYDSPFVILTLDLDHFKLINDQHGHLAGDEYLKQFAQCIRDTLRASDGFFRVGGEEFTILLANQTLEQAGILAERVRKQVETLQCQYRDSQIKTTVSIGMSQVRHEDNLNSLLYRADQDLYTAKHLGRNQIFSSDSALHQLA